MDKSRYRLNFTDVDGQTVSLIGWNHHTPKHNGQAKAWLKTALPAYAKQLPVKTFDSYYGHGFGFRVDVDGGYFTFEGMELDPNKA